jgi:hypothetical protein
MIVAEGLLAEVVHPARFLHDMKLVTFRDANSSGIITSVLKPPKPVQKDWRCLMLSYISDYTAHNWFA